MIKDSPETASVFVLTPRGQEPDTGEIEEAVKLSYARGFAAKEMCPQIGNCAVRVCHEMADSQSGKSRIDDYRLVCELECPLLIDEASDVPD